MSETTRRIMLTEPDYDRLQALLRGAAGKKAREREALEEELDNAEVVGPSEIPPDVVTMNSRVRFVDEESGEERDMTLVYPADADAEQGRISVLAPVGAALLGLSVGQTIDWPMPDGSSRRLRVVNVLYQPEAAGEFDR